jgi:protoheme IX farnesyltransferase
LNARVDVVDEAAPSSAPRGRFLLDLVALTKPRITAMVVITMLGGMWLATRSGGPQRPALTLALAVLGTVLVVSGASALNMYIERDSDRFMARTKNRPLPSGRMAPEIALWFGLALSALAVPLLTFTVNALTGLLAALALVSYVLVYTPLKRTTTLSLPVGAVPGAIPPLLGWTAVTGHLEWPGVLLFSVMFLWQIPHFLAIATFRREDYRRAGLKILPVERGDRVTRHHIVAYLVALVVVTLMLVPFGVGGSFYLASAIALGAVFLGFGAYGLRPSAGARWARGLFITSILYLVLLLGALALNPSPSGAAHSPDSQASLGGP